MLLPTTLVGSYPQPDWLIDRAKLSKQVPRVRAHDLWLVDPQRLDGAQDDATLLAIRDQERAGLDIITDGEQRRESYSNRFATALAGIDLDNPGKTPNRTGGFSTVPRVVGPIRRKYPVEVRDVEFLRANTDRMIKMTVPGPFTMSAQCQDDFYGDEERLALDYAAAVNAEINDLVAAGEGAQIRGQGARSGARGRRWDDGGAYLLRLCRGGEGQAFRLFVPGGVRTLGGRSGLDRGCSAQARSVGLATIAVEDDHPRGHRSVGPDGRGARNRRRAHPQGIAVCPGRADRGGAGLRPQISSARGRIRKNARDGRRRRDRAPRDRGIEIMPRATIEDRSQPCPT